MSLRSQPTSILSGPCNPRSCVPPLMNYLTIVICSSDYLLFCYSLNSKEQGKALEYWLVGTEETQNPIFNAYTISSSQLQEVKSHLLFLSHH
jgi:hypothetical protein